MIPAAALAVIRAAIEDTDLAEFAHRPGHTAVRITEALKDAGWDLSPTRPENGRHKAA
jgi:hypothetical protein